MSLASGEYGKPVTGEEHRRPAEATTVSIAQSSVLEQVNRAIDPLSDLGKGNRP